MELKIKGGKVLIDDEDYHIVRQYNWGVSLGYAKTKYVRNNKIIRISMHRLILNVLDKPELFVDHKDHDKLNNQKSNIRICTKAQNEQNRKPRLGATSQYLGVTKITTLMKRTGKYKVKYYAQIKNKKIGYFDDEIEAAKAYDKKAIELYGEFARPNFNG